jgi:hypothetical protein
MELNTYRVYILDTRNPEQPTVIVAFVRAPKYGEGWKAANHVLAGQPLDGDRLYADQECKTPLPAEIAGDAFKTAKVDDLRPRSAKLDKAKLIEILNDPKKSAADKVKAAMALTGGQAAAA